jgi:hypothetical protein
MAFLDQAAVGAVDVTSSPERVEWRTGRQVQDNPGTLSKMLPDQFEDMNPTRSSS